MKRKTQLVHLTIATAVLTAPGRLDAQLWLSFAHPWDPHTSGNPPWPDIAFQSLFDNEAAIVEVPVVVILMKYKDEPDPARTPAYFHELFFGSGISVDPTRTPALVEYYDQVSNGRFAIVPANESSGTANDGVIGWVEAPNSLDYYDNESKRAEAIRLADAYIDYSQYNENGDYVLGPRELSIHVVDSTFSSSGHAADPGSIVVDDGELLIVRTIVPALGQAAKEEWQHESSHAVLGLGDLYNKCALDWVTSTGDGYICDTPAGFSDDCRIQDPDGSYRNNECGCPVSLDVTIADSDIFTNDGYASQFLPACGTNAAATKPAAWFEVYGSGKTIYATTCSSATLMDTHINVYCNGCDGQTCVAGNDDDLTCYGHTFNSRVEFCGEPGVSYLIAVYTHDSDRGELELTVWEGNQCSSTFDCGLAAAHGRHWYPFGPGPFTSMANGTEQWKINELDPWAKIHLGFTEPKVVTHDGSYAVYDAETVRSFGTQDSEPEAWIVYDPLRGFDEYFVLENRNEQRTEPYAPGLAVWLFNERWLEPFPGYEEYNHRRTVRMVQMGGYKLDSGFDLDLGFLWNGVEEGYYDLTANSSPRDTNWSDGTPSFIEIYNISQAGTEMTFSVQMPGIMVDDDAGPLGFGTIEYPFQSLQQGVNAIPEPPRTILVAGGNYPDSITIDTPCTIKHWKDGASIIGE